MENITKLTVSAGNFLRVQCMEYSCIEVEKSIILKSDEMVIIDCVNPMISNYNKQKLVRKVIDFDAIELVSGRLNKYSVILINENFGAI